MRPGELSAALLAVWRVISLVVLLILAAPWVVTHGQLASVIPACEWQVKYHRPCPLCGMTTAFFAIREGDFNEARRDNQASVPLFGAMALNECLAAGQWLLGRKRRRSCSASRCAA